MHLIYYCATITIFAVAGPHSDYGIPGISKPRVGSTRERINGKDLVVVPPQVMTEIKSSVWQTRAWTWQEDVLSTRKLYLTETQWILQCNETLGPSDYTEAHDTAVDLTWTMVSGGKMKADHVEASRTNIIQVLTLIHPGHKHRVPRSNFLDVHINGNNIHLTLSHQRR
jgi:hypothetical protein